MVSLFGPLPTRGPWTALGLTRGQFVTILGLSVGLFLVVGGPVWRHLRDAHFWRLALSYAVIPPAVAWALRRNGSSHALRIVVASGVLALLKLLITAGLLVLLALLAQ
jgi:hypothetical protein